MDNNVARLYLVSAQHAYFLINATTESLLAFYVGDPLADVTLSRTAPIQGRKAGVFPTIDRIFNKWRLNCRMVDAPDFERFDI
jgi:hypothetical protein